MRIYVSGFYSDPWRNLWSSGLLLLYSSSCPSLILERPDQRFSLGWKFLWAGSTEQIQSPGPVIYSAYTGEYSWNWHHNHLSVNFPEQSRIIYTCEMSRRKRRGKPPNTKTKNGFCVIVLILAGEVQPAILCTDCQKQKHEKLKLKWE